MTWDDRVAMRVLQPGEGATVTAAIRTAYGDTYDAEWVYDPAEVDRRLSDGLLVAVVAEDHTGELLAHTAASLHGRNDRVAHAGQAVTVPDARGHHLFERLKRFQVETMAQRGLVGIYSEATAAHPYSQRANAAIGARETGFLLGWIPAEVANDAAGAGPRPRRQSAALFYLRIAHAPARPAFVPERHRDVVHETIRVCDLHARLADPPRRLRRPRHSTVHVHVRRDHNLAVATVTASGRDLPDQLDTVRRRWFAEGLDALYVDLPLDDPAVAAEAEALDEGDRRFAYAGIFPNAGRSGDVLRLQALNGAVVDPHDIATVTDEGRRLLAYVLDDLGATGHEVAPAAVGGAPGTTP